MIVPRKDEHSMTGTLPEAYEPPDGEPRRDDAESYVHEPNMIGGPVDPEPEPATLYGTVTRRKDDRRPPIIPAWLRNGDQRKAFARQFAGLVLYVVLMRTTRSPWYLIKIGFYAPWGLLLLLGRQVRWATHPELTSMMQTAAVRNDLDHGPHIADKVSAARKARFGALLGEVLAAVVGLTVLLLLAPPWAPWAALAAALPLLARVGRPADKPILNRVLDGPRFTRLTAEMVRKALVDINVPGLKEPGQLQFPTPGIHREGPGWLARVNLPPGVLATQIMEKRTSLSSALRLPVGSDLAGQGPGP
jgi:S-DNA-T family DNA segregation ATPase FtsK/SpoIIIE